MKAEFESELHEELERVYRRKIEKSKKSQNLFLACDPKLVFTVGMQHCSALTEKTTDSESPIDISSDRNELKMKPFKKFVMK